MRVLARNLLAVTALSVGSSVVFAAPTWAGGPDGVIEGDMSRAVGSGLLNGTLTGFSASGQSNEQAAAAVIAACQAADAEQCSSDEVTNDVFCVVSVGADDGSGIVAGGAGDSVPAARDDAFRNAARAYLVLDPSARVLASSCP